MFSCPIQSGYGELMVNSESMPGRSQLVGSATRSTVRDLHDIAESDVKIVILNIFEFKDVADYMNYTTG